MELSNTYDSNRQSPLTQPGAIELVRRFHGLRALVIGDAMLDTYLEGSAERLCTEGPVPVVRKSGEYHIPGGAANTAANLAALGAEVIFLGLVGDDLVGHQLRQELRLRNVDDSWLVTWKQQPTLHKIRLLANGQYLARFDEGSHPAEEEGNAEEQADLLSHLERAFPLCDLVIVSDYRYGVLSTPLIERLCSLQADARLPLIVDSKMLPRYSALEATVVTPNLAEARQFISAAGGSPSHTISETPIDEARVLAQQLLRLLASQHIAITLGHDGVFLLDRQGQEHHLPASTIAQAHDVGAGDTFTSAMALALAVSNDVVQSAQIGLDAASIAVSRARTAIVSHHDLLQHVSLRAYKEQNDLMPSGRVLSADELANRLEIERQQGKRIVFTNGIFDILHAGHIHLLRQARTLGDILVVGVNTDKSARRLKGYGRPINSAQERLALVSALDGVDYVLLFDEDTPSQLIRTLRPHTHVKGGDYAEEALPEASTVREVGGQVIIVPLLGGISTSAVIERVARAAMLRQPSSQPYTAQKRRRA